MKELKILNMNIPTLIFKDICFDSVSEAKFKLKNSDNIKITTTDNSFVSYGSMKENSGIALIIKKNFEFKNYIEGIHYTINILI